MVLVSTGCTCYGAGIYRVYLLWCWYLQVYLLWCWYLQGVLALVLVSTGCTCYGAAIYRVYLLWYWYLQGVLAMVQQPHSKLLTSPRCFATQTTVLVTSVAADCITTRSHTHNCRHIYTYSTVQLPDITIPAHH